MSRQGIDNLVNRVNEKGITGVEEENWNLNLSKVFWDQKM
jgi:hypothetical protein